MKKVLSGFIPFLFLLPVLIGQTPSTYTSAEILLQLRKLNSLGSVLYVAAHPDDENTRLLSYFAKEKLYRTGYLSITRGDGGQNLIGEEQGIELGMIRTQELLAARRIDGADQFFTRAYDFGFSKTTEEAFKIWDKEKVLYDVVWVIRKFQPDVIITRFPEDSRAGHGHHSGSAVLAHEAFKLAADPTKFTEQFRLGVKPWQAKRILWNTFVFGATNTTSEDQIKFDVGVYNPILGKSYGEIAAESRSLHKSQGFGVPRSRGQAMEYFTLLEGSPASRNDLLDGVNTSWARVEGGEKLQLMIDQIINSYSITNPERSVPALVNLYKEISKLNDGIWKTSKLKEVQQLVEQCAGLWLETTSNNPYAVQGDSLRFNFSMINRSHPSVMLKQIRMDGIDSTFNDTLRTNRVNNFARTLAVSTTKKVTQPYWLESEMSEGSFNVADPSLIGNPESAPAYQVQFVLNIDGQDFTYTRAVQYKFTDPVKGELYQPITVLPGVTGRFDPDIVLLNTKDAKNFDVLTRKQSRFASDVKINILNTGSVRIQPGGSNGTGLRTYQAIRTNTKSEIADTRLSFDNNGQQEVARELRTIAYDHIPRLDYFQTPKLRLVTADIKTVGKRIGYIIGAGDKVPEALEQMGYEVVLLRDKELARNNLQQFDAIITGVRAYNTNEWMNNYYEKLMRYVEDGGNLIVQYNTNSQIGPVRAKIGPYNFNISRTRVADEKASVNFLKPDHAVLNFPNKIGQEDFNDWVQERSNYHATAWDNKFETVFSLNDAGEKADEGSLIIARHGKGVFVYTGLVFFRQLPAGVPGAYRLLANIIALNHKKAF